MSNPPAGSSLRRSTSAAATVAALVFALLATAPLNVARAGGTGCCQCSCGVGEQVLCGATTEVDCSAFCTGRGCSFGSFTQGRTCAEVAACTQVTSSPAPVLGGFGVIAAALAALVFGLRRLQRS